MKYTRTFKELNKNDAPIAGGKGASLGEMTQTGIPVPGGFVVLSTTFDHFLHATDLTQEIDSILQAVDHKVIHTVESASEKIRGLIEGQTVPEDIANEVKAEFKNLDAQFVAVRSSATAEDGVEHAWAGQLDSFLNTTEENLLENMKKCWSSLFTPRAIFYRFEKGLHGTQISVAVVVQKMIQSEISGIAFSVHPITEDTNQLIIEAGFGLGEAIVSGSVTPDSYVVEKNPRKIIDVNVSTQTKGLFGLPTGGNEWRSIEEPRASSRVLNTEDILELAELVIKIENHYGFPCDIEWGYEAGKFYIVQSRPITTLSNEVQNKNFFKKDDYILTFWVKGVSVFVTDVHLDAYKKLEVLYIIDKGLFKQYFTKKAYEQALEKGFEFYSDENKFDTYKKELSLHCKKLKEFFESEIKNQENFSVEKVITFFEYINKLCGDYSQMNFESTDKAFVHQEQNPVTKRNLTEVAKFKDVVRAVMNTALFEPDGYLSKFFAILTKQFDINASILDNLTRREILELFEGKRPNESMVSKRQEAFVESYNIAGFLSGKEAEAIIQEFKENVSHSDIIKGQVASKGRVTGKVKIIPVDYSNFALVNNEMEKMEQGEILVAETTAPELMIACKKAGAIVTDTGGLMSHAAIVSREFGIPCIIGTKFATQLLKDGDLVEVDADNGVVRILNKNIEFNKIYTRDTTYIMQELWAYGCSEGIEKEFGWKNPSLPGIIHHMNQGSIEIWENLRATQWLQDTILERNNKDPEFIDHVLKKYKEKLSIIHKLWKEKVLPVEDLEKLISLSKEALTYFIPYYYSAVDDRTPKDIRDKALEMRNKDEFFAENDMVIRDSLTNLYPELKGYETTLFFAELESTQSMNILKERRESSFVVQGKEKFVGSLNEFNKMHPDFVFKKDIIEQIDITEIKGEIAQKGKVTGKVKILRRRDQINEVTAEDIIVSPMTTPDFLPAMKIAKAFVTDEGGITCHAGIVARELKKPCIIGTKIATQVLKDGMEVEVDADNGIIRILK